MFKFKKLLSRFLLLGVLSSCLGCIFVDQVKASGISNFLCQPACVNVAPGVYEVCDEMVVWNGWTYTRATDETLCSTSTFCAYDSNPPHKILF